MPELNCNSKWNRWGFSFTQTSVYKSFDLCTLCTMINAWSELCAFTNNIFFMLSTIHWSFLKLVLLNIVLITNVLNDELSKIRSSFDLKNTPRSGIMRQLYCIKRQAVCLLTWSICVVIRSWKLQLFPKDQLLLARSYTSQFYLVD